MSLWDYVTRALALEPLQHPPLKTREGPSFSDFLARYRPSSRAEWTPATVTEALSVPAIFGIVSTISNTIGTLSLEAYRNGELMAPEDRPTIVKRPQPNRRPGSFWRDSAWNLATRGEAWWWVTKRDDDGQPLSLLNLPPQQVIVEENRDNLLEPIIRWGEREIPNRDIRQISFIRDAGDLRGKGPLQMCGAAVSVAVEAQEWAANFYAEGGKGGTIVKSAQELGMTPDGWDAEAAEHEAEILRRQWVAKGNNLVRVIDPNIAGVEEHEPNEAGAQMLTARDFQVGEVARMFSYPMSLIGYAVNGSSITYANLGDRFDELTRLCLIPHFLEKFEQEMSDLLTRSTTVEFNVERLRRADIKTRWEVYEIMAKVIGVEEAARIARQGEGIDAGGIETAPVPFSPPQALPAPISAFRSEMQEVRHICPSGGRTRFLGRGGGGSEHFCAHCKQLIVAA